MSPEIGSVIASVPRECIQGKVGDAIIKALLRMLLGCQMYPDIYDACGEDWGSQLGEQIFWLRLCVLLACPGPGVSGKLAENACYCGCRSVVSPFRELCPSSRKGT